jgi:hypothetical protein
MSVGAYYPGQWSFGAGSARIGFLAEGLGRPADASQGFMAHRIREAMADKEPSPMGGEGKVIEADEAHQGKKEIPTRSRHRRGRPYLKKGKAAEKRPIRCSS